MQLKWISNLFEPRTLSKTEKKKDPLSECRNIHRSTACRCISSAIYCGISSMHSIVYHQVADTYTLARDDIQPKGLIIYECISRQRRVMHSMIYQVCDLDKKRLQKLSLLQSFLERITGKRNKSNWVLFLWVMFDKARSESSRRLAKTMTHETLRHSAYTYCRIANYATQMDLELVRAPNTK